MNKLIELQKFKDNLEMKDTIHSVLNTVDRSKETLLSLIELSTHIRNMEDRIISLKYVIENYEELKVSDECLSDIVEEYNTLYDTLVNNFKSLDVNLYNAFKLYDFNIESLLKKAE